jgi:hypothetical protein
MPDDAITGAGIEMGPVYEAEQDQRRRCVAIAPKATGCRIFVNGSKVSDCNQPRDRHRLTFVSHGVVEATNPQGEL